MIKELTIADVEQQMAANRAKQGKELAALEADKTLSVEGRAGKMAAVKREAHDAHEQLKRERAAAVKTEQDRYYVRAFQRGLGSIDSYRTVYSMAAAAQDAKALERLKAQAVNTNDSILLKAIWQAGYDRGFIGLLHDAPAEVQNLLEFEYDNFLRKATDSAGRTRQLEQRLGLSIRTTAP